MGLPCLQLPDPGFASALRASLEEYGFAAIEGHGISPALIDATYAACRRLFALDDATKARIGCTAGGARGFTAFGVEHAVHCAVPDLKEFFHVGRDGNRWPEAVPELAEHSIALFDALEDCAQRLLDALAVAYGLSEASFSELTQQGNHVLRALHYPPVGESADPSALRAAPHEDINLITLLCEASDAGLEILRPDGRWLAVEASVGRIVVDAGDMLARLTNGAIPATTHRVVNPPETAGRHRYSLPFFAHPRAECDLAVRPEFVTVERPARTAPITAGEFLEERLREIGLG